MWLTVILMAVVAALDPMRVAALVVISRFVLRPVLKQVAALKAQEAFTALSLLVVAGTAVAMEEIGLSATLGAFLAAMPSPGTRTSTSNGAVAALVTGTKSFTGS